MIVCTNCQHNNFEGDTFCDNCGTSLGAPTNTFAEPVDPQVPNPAAQPAAVTTQSPIQSPFGVPVAAPVSAPVAAARPRFVLSNGKEFDLSQLAETEIGRSDPAVPWKAPMDLQDLLDDTVIEQGISRHHAKVSVQGGHVTITDLGSTNGTFVAGQRIQPQSPVPLLDYQEVKLGKVQLVFRDS